MSQLSNLIFHRFIFNTILYRFFGFHIMHPALLTSQFLDSCLSPLQCLPLKKSHKLINTKQNKQNPTSILCIPCLSSTSSFFFVALGAAVFPRVCPFVQRAQQTNVHCNKSLVWSSPYCLLAHHHHWTLTKTLPRYSVVVREILWLSLHRMSRFMHSRRS